MSAPGRREVLKAVGLTGAGFVAGCATRRRGVAFFDAPRTFARVKVAPERVIRTVAGLRPYRSSGFVVRAEKMGDTLVVHNYGHGGAGVTLSWGCAREAATLLAGGAAPATPAPVT